MRFSAAASPAHRLDARSRVGTIKAFSMGAPRRLSRGSTGENRRILSRTEVLRHRGDGTRKGPQLPVCGLSILALPWLTLDSKRTARSGQKMANRPEDSKIA